MVDFVRSEEFKKRVSKKPAPLAAAVVECVYRLSENPRHPSLRTHKVKGFTNAKGGPIFEAYVDKSHRVTFHYEDEKIVLRTNCEHDAVLRRP